MYSPFSPFLILLSQLRVCSRFQSAAERSTECVCVCPNGALANILITTCHWGDMVSMLLKEKTGILDI